MMFALLAAAAALSAPSSALSSREEVAKPAVPAAETAALPTAPAVAAKPTRYCFLNVEEDHIMRGKVCKTRKQWMWSGVDPLDYIGRNK